MTTIFISGCDVFLEEKPDCEEKLIQFYDNGCALAMDDEQMSELEAVDYCEEGLEETKEMGCEKYVYRWLKCSDQITEGNCNGCDYHLEDMYECIDEAESVEEYYE